MPLDPQAKEFLDAIIAANRPAWSEMPPHEGRELFASFTDLFGEGPELQSVDSQLVANVPIRIYSPFQKSIGCVIYFHGGGWVLGDLDTHDSLCRRLCDASGCAVIAVDYRRSPEHRFPEALQDSYAVVQFAHENASTLNFPSDRIVVAGDSAGGNLAAAVCLKARNEKGPAIQLQALIYPVLDSELVTDSYSQFAEGYGLTKDTMAWFWDQYVSGELDRLNPLASPTRESDLTNLPTAHVMTAEFDVLRDEGEHFANALRSAGVQVTLVRYSGQIHGFLHYAGVFDAARIAMEDLGNAVQQHLT